MKYERTRREVMCSKKTADLWGEFKQMHPDIFENGSIVVASAIASDGAFIELRMSIDVYRKEVFYKIVVDGRPWHSAQSIDEAEEVYYSLVNDGVASTITKYTASEKKSAYRKAFMDGFKAGMRKKSTTVDLADGYTLHIYDNGQMEITKHRPYVFGDSAYAVSTSGRTWAIKVMHDTPINTSFETVDTITSYDPDYSDVVEYLYHLDDGLEDTRFVDKW